MYDPQARILIFSKVPEAGRVKTRLIPWLGAEGAARLYEELLTGLLTRITALPVAPLEMWCTPVTDVPFFRELAERFQVELRQQTGADLGERLRHAAEDALGRSDRVVLIGADCPEMDAAFLDRALCTLNDRDAVLGPAEDGGYVLLGLKRAAKELFFDLPWGEPRVAEMTRARMLDLGWDWEELPELWDVDRPEDVDRYLKRVESSEDQGPRAIGA